MARHFPAPQGALSNYKKFGDEPPDHAIGRSRGGLTTKNHLVCDGKGRALAFILTPGQTADTSMLTATLSEIRIPGARGKPRSRPDRVLADKGYPSKVNRAWLREHGIAATIPERDDQIAHRRKRRGRPIDFGDQQRTRYRGRNVVERCFNKLKQWRGIAVPRVDEPAVCGAWLLLRLGACDAGFPKDARQRRGRRHRAHAQRPHLVVHADRPVVQPGLLQCGPHADGLPFDLVAQLRRARRRATRLRLECRRRLFFDDAFADRVERLAGDAVLGAERAHRPARGISGPLRDGEADTGINRLRWGHSPI